jgi:tetratricopeptide (TPR) repeat protein
MVGGSTQVTVTEIADADPRLDRIESLMLDGRMLAALGVAEAIAPLQTFRGPRAQVFAAWLTDHLGGDELARRFYLRAARSAPQHPSVRFFYAFLVLRERGPVQAWLVLRDYTPPETTTPTELAELASLRARVLAFLLDHRMAERALSECDPGALGPGRFASTEATLFEQRGEKKRALEILERALAKEPRSRVLVQHTVMLLEGQNRRAEALALLDGVDTELEAPALTLQRAGLEHELKRFDAELASIERAERLLVRAGRKTRSRLSLMRAENAYRRGDMRSAALNARRSGEAWWTRFANQLDGLSGMPERKELDVQIVLQDPMSCAPASLAMLSGYFGHVVDHVDVADQICYEGTAAHSERGWAEKAGFVSREFTVTFASACALIERGVPFLLVTVEIASAHAQVVIGFDATRRSLIVRDPMTYRVVELDADPMFERHRAYGPRGHVLVPADRAALLDGIDLPDVELHDLAHRLRLALERHDRAAVDELTSEIERRSPGHALALWARRSVAHANQDLYAIRNACERILASHPKDVNAEMTVLECLDTIGTTSDKRERLEKRLQAAEVPWIFHELHAQLLSADAAELERARRLARRALARVPTRGRTLELVARLERDLGASALSLCLYRAAATLESTDDELARRYFEEALRAGSAEQALELLADRAERFRARSGQPAMVLFGALEWLDRVDEAFEALSLAIDRRPEDGALLLYAAEAHARYRRPEEARSLLERAARHASPEAYEQSAARVAEIEGRLADALARHRAVLDTTPLALGSHAAVAYLLGELSGIEDARRHLTDACARYPTHCRLRELLIEWLRGHDPDHVLPEIDELLAMQPAHAWARRERALTLSGSGEHERAIAEAREACALAPQHAASHRVLATVLVAAGQRAEALAPARKAVDLLPDEPGAILGVLRLAGSLEEQRELLAELGAKVGNSTLNGTGLIEWYDYASGLLDDAELLERARLALAERPTLWACHHVVARRLLRTGDATAARELLTAATARFPFVTRLFIDLADAYRTEGDGENEVAAALRATHLGPDWIFAALHAAEVLVRNRDRDASRRVLERALGFHPRSAELVRELATLAWDADDPERAFRESRRAVELDPEDETGWLLHYRFACTLEREPEVVALAKRLAEERPWNAVIWLRLADILRRESENLASLDALAEALDRRPRWAEALDLYAITLTRIGRKEEALSACQRPTDTFFAQGAMKARRAWVYWTFGDQALACSEMKRVVVEHPDHVWSHMMLVEWQSELGQHEQAVEVARALVELAPLNATSYGYLGDALLGAGKPKKARAAFEQAAALDPSYAYAGAKRLELAIQAQRWEAGARVLDEQGPHVPPETRDSWEVSLSAARRDDASALAAFERLASRPTVPVFELYRAAKELENLPAYKIARPLERLARNTDVNAELGSIWVTTLDNLGRRPSAFAIRRLRHDHPQAFATAVRAYFEVLGDRSSGLLRLLAALLVLGAEARRNDATWGKVGYALTRTRAYVVGQLWLADYAERQDAQAWMLHNYRVAALENHQPAAALRAVEHALTLPADDTLPHHLAFAAFGRAVSGNIEGAREMVGGRVFQNLGGQEQWLFDSAQRLVRLADTQGQDRADELSELRLSAGSVLRAVEPFVLGLLQRWLAAGVLRQTWDPAFLLRRFAPWLALLAFLSIGPFRSGNYVTLLFLVGAYVTTRLFR